MSIVKAVKISFCAINQASNFGHCQTIFVLYAKNNHWVRRLSDTQTSATLPKPKTVSRDTPTDVWLCPYGALSTK